VLPVSHTLFGNLLPGHHHPRNYFDTFIFLLVEKTLTGMFPYGLFV